MEITCPSGLRGIIRPMKGTEAKAFVDPNIVRQYASMETLFANCWIETLDPGPYELVDSPKKGEPQRPRWRDRVLLGDRSAVLLDVRTVTFGPTYDFNVQCEQDGCRQKYGWELELPDLARRPLPEESLEKIKAGKNSFEHVLPDGTTLIYKLPTGLEEIATAKLKGGQGSAKRLTAIDGIFVQSLGLYVPEGVDLDGVKISEHAKKLTLETGIEAREYPGGPMAIRKYLEEMNLPDIEELQTAMQLPDCGVETKIETVCEHCGWQQWIELPFQRSFFERRKKQAS